MSIRITVEAYGELNSLCGGPSQQLDLPETGDVADVLRVLGERYPQAQAQLTQTACAIGDALVSRRTSLQPGQTLVLIPPVSGG